MKRTVIFNVGNPQTDKALRTLTKQMKVACVIFGTSLLLDKVRLLVLYSKTVDLEKRIKELENCNVKE